jgi:hypothetical protein
MKRTFGFRAPLACPSKLAAATAYPAAVNTDLRVNEGMGVRASVNLDRDEIK